MNIVNVIIMICNKSLYDDHENNDNDKFKISFKKFYMDNTHIKNYDNMNR
jgi:hypothetical protein